MCVAVAIVLRSKRNSCCKHALRIRSWAWSDNKRSNDLQMEYPWLAFSPFGSNNRNRDNEKGIKGHSRRFLHARMCFDGIDGENQKYCTVVHTCDGGNVCYSCYSTFYWET